MESRSKFFPLKSGQCHIYPDRIEIISDHALGRLLAKRGIQRVAVIYLLWLLAFSVAIWVSFFIENYFLVVFFSIAWLFCLYAMWRNRRVSTASVIDRKHIRKVTYQEAIPGTARASFTIYFQPGKQLLQRKILLPSILQNGQMVAQSAYYMLKDEGLIKP
ncbi:MAG: hypothetical protein D6730_14870 [Bacteroidetes bacterium]|nr:MAG: hypothetical protein D6730_14870 [Bacteroidota bacterium]